MRFDVRQTYTELVGDLTRTAGRFPFPTLAAALLTIYILFEIDQSHDELMVRTIAGLCAAFLWTLALSLIAETRNWPIEKEAPLALAGTAAIALALTYAQAIDLVIPALLAGLTLFLAIAPYTARIADQPAFWFFNHQFWVAAGLSLVAAVLFAGGLSAIIESLRYLFGLPIPNSWHQKIWTIATCFISPMMWLSLTPERFDVRVAEGRQLELTSNAVDILVKYILVPLLLIYALILHAYAIKILAEYELPKGRIGWMVLTYAAMTTIAALLAFPGRDTNGPHVRLFWKYWPFLLAIPALLLFIAIGVRINQYGVTEDRYFVVLAGVWMVILVVTQGAWPGWRDQRVTPGSLALLFFAAALGPWGIKGASVWSQKSAFVSGLEQSGIIKNGKVAVSKEPPPAKLGANQPRVHAALDYLTQARRLSVLAPIFAGDSANPFAKPQSEQRYADLIKDRLGLSKSYSSAPRYNHRNFAVKQPYMLAPPPSRRLYGPIYIYITTQAQKHRLPADLEITSKLENNTLELTIPGAGPASKFDLMAQPELATALSDHGPTNTTHQSPLRLTSRSGTSIQEILLITANAQPDDTGTMTVRNVQIWLALPK